MTSGKSKIFLLYNDEDISEYSHPDIIPLKLNQTVYFESEAFRMLSDSDLPDVENIGFITPSIKIKIKNFSIKNILTLNPDPITFLALTNIPCEKDIIDWRGKDFINIWKYILDCHSIPHSIINTYCGSLYNFWVAKKSFVIEYLKFAKQTIFYLDNAPENIKLMLRSDPLYNGKLLNTGILEKKFNLSHYPFHPFILEHIIDLFTKTFLNKLQTRKILVFMSDNRELEENYELSK